MKRVTICTYILIFSIIVFGVIYRLFNFHYTNEGIFNMDEISIGQYGSGPKTTFSFGIDSENQHLISEGFYVRCKGYNLYEYSKK